MNGNESKDEDSTVVPTDHGTNTTNAKVKKKPIKQVATSTGDDRLTRPMPPVDPLRKQGDGNGPSKPDVKRPESRNILDRMVRLNPEKAVRYRQRSGE